MRQKNSKITETHNLCRSSKPVALTTEELLLCFIFLLLRFLVFTSAFVWKKVKSQLINRKMKFKTSRKNAYRPWAPLCQACLAFAHPPSLKRDQLVNLLSQQKHQTARIRKSLTTRFQRSNSWKKKAGLAQGKSFVTNTDQKQTYHPSPSGSSSSFSGLSSDLKPKPNPEFRKERMNTFICFGAMNLAHRLFHS